MKFKINSKTVKKTKKNKYREDWSIQTAEDGDIIRWNSSNMFFIFKDINTNHKYRSTASEDAIVYHVCYDFSSKNLNIGPDTGVGTLQTHASMQLANDDEIKDLMKVLKDNGYEWDEFNNELNKI